MQILDEQLEKQRFMEKNDKKEVIEKLKSLGVMSKKKKVIYSTSLTSALCNSNMTWSSFYIEKLTETAAK